MTRLLPLLSALALAACGGPGSFSGTVAGNGLPVKDSIFAVINDASGKPQAGALVIADQPNICATLKSGKNPKNASYLGLGLVQIGLQGVSPPNVGDYTVITGLPSTLGNFAFGSFVRNDVNCMNTIAAKNAVVTGGLVKVGSYKAVTGGTMSGTFDLTVGDQADKVTGTFNAAFCDVTSTTLTACE